MPSTELLHSSRFSRSTKEIVWSELFESKTYFGLIISRKTLDRYLFVIHFLKSSFPWWSMWRRTMLLFLDIIVFTQIISEPGICKCCWRPWAHILFLCTFPISWWGSFRSQSSISTHSMIQRYLKSPLYKYVKRIKWIEWMVSLP